MVEDFNSDFEVEDADNFKYGDDNKFNHQTLVMNAIKKCMEAGSVELMEGWWEERIDKQGNRMKSYHGDTRKVFINSIKTLMSITECDYDETAKKIIPDLLKQLEDKKKFWLQQEINWWNSLNNIQKNKMSADGKMVSPGYFNKNLDYDNYYYEDEILVYRSILTEINNLTSRLDFYGSSAYEA